MIHSTHHNCHAFCCNDTNSLFLSRPHMSLGQEVRVDTATLHPCTTFLHNLLSRATVLESSPSTSAFLVSLFMQSSAHFSWCACGVPCMVGDLRPLSHCFMLFMRTKCALSRDHYRIIEGVCLTNLIRKSTAPLFTQIFVTTNTK